MNTTINTINYGIANLGIQVIKKNQRQVVEAYLAGRDVLISLANWFRQKSNFPHCTVCVRLFKAWRTRKDRVNLSCCRAPPFTDERPSCSS